MAELGIAKARSRRCPGRDYGDGRYAFWLYAGHRRCEVQMPGWPLGQVRWQPDADAWQFPRLYVDGGSWLWGFAVGIARGALAGDGDTDAR